MNASSAPASPWTRFSELYFEFPACGLSVDLSRLDLEPGYLEQMAQPMSLAFEAMKRLEAGEIANPDEGRMVGHYWLRDAARAPSAELRGEITGALKEVREFAAAVHEGRHQGERGEFRNLLVVGIGGSALGPQFIAGALGHPVTDRLEVRFFDNTDPDGMDRTLASWANDLGRTLVVVISKSGTTPETRNGMVEVAEAYRRASLDFARHAVAVTQFDEKKSALYRKALQEGWLACFPMWDWVGGRTSVTSAVGLLPAALQGVDIGQFLEGAKACDEVTRGEVLRENPAALLAVGWYQAGAGRGARDMVVLPYKDRLELLSRYLQQLVMESLGKEIDLSGRVVNQGLAVYGNKGSTDQHAYVQQLREGLNNFFAVFLRVLRGRAGESVEVDPGFTAGDYLNGFLLGTRAALYEKQRPSITLTVPEVSAYAVGVLIALFERTVGLYASLVGINAYHQPGVEAGKRAAAGILELQALVLKALKARPGQGFNAEELAAAAGSDDAETVFHLGLHLAASGRGIQASGKGASTRFSA